MDKKIGNFYAVLIACFIKASLLHASGISIDLAIKNIQGKSIKQVGVNVPFMVEIVMVDTQSIAGHPQIKGVDQIVINTNQPAISTIHTTINGVLSVKKIYRYSAYALQEGSVTIGPAFIMHNAERYESKVVSLTISSQTNTAEPIEAFLKTIVSKESVFKGEPFSLALRFYAQNGITLQSLSNPDFSKFRAKPLEGPFSGSEDIQGINYSFVEWRTTLVPQQEGMIVIPPIKAFYRIPVQRKRSNRFGFDFFDHFLDNGETRELYSNAQSIMAYSLPPYNASIDAIGSFKNFKASLDRTEAKVGEGIVLRLAVEGTGDVDGAAHPVLKLPSELTYYESTMNIEPSEKDSFKKIFEYILQAKEHGSYTIGEQSFTFFDSNRGNYQVLKTAPLSITIINNSLNDIPQIAEEFQSKSHAAIAWPMVSDAWFGQAYREIPWHYLLIAMLLMPLFLCMRWCMGRMRKTSPIFSFFEQKRYLSSTLQAIELAQKNNNMDALYENVMSYVQKKLSVLLIDESMLIDRIEKSYGMTKKIQWQEFLVKLNEYHFTKKELLDETIFTQAKEWITLLDSIV